MRKQIKLNSIIRIIDANINRSKEGLRVCEEVTRFMLEDAQLTRELKNARHEISSLIESLISKQDLLDCRYSEEDVGMNILGKELKRADVEDIFIANIQRVKESIRVLEEFSKLINKQAAIGFKKMRYRLYETEKKALKKITALSHIR
ncbi:MAG: thiamine-phosphate pyrophosphorylase [Candidatus Omnitrophota bacterium]